MLVITTWLQQVQFAKAMTDW